MPPNQTLSAPQEIHGHEVIAMILASRLAYTRESLINAIRARFGPETRFYTCSAAGMDAAELVRFLEARGKFMPAEGGFTVDPARVCKH
ncbi:MAG: YecH family metal-binding protein [Opitutaceae bacterium]